MAKTGFSVHYLATLHITVFSTIHTLKSLKRISRPTAIKQSFNASKGFIICNSKAMLPQIRVYAQNSIYE